MGEHSKPPVQHATWTQTADARGHAVACVDVEPRLGPVYTFEIANWLSGSAGQVQFLRVAAEVVPGGDDLYRRRFLLQLDRNRFRVAILDSDAITVGAHGEGCGNELRPVEIPQKFEG